MISSRRRSALPASPTRCRIPTYEGSGLTTHPSVVDMGERWGGYRWWLADTPYPRSDSDYENPGIWASNDRVNWEVPSGVTNPLVPNPPHPAWHSDTELVWDPEGGRMIAYWRLSLGTPNVTQLHAATSPDGHTWDLLGMIADISNNPRASPAIERVTASEWRMWLFANALPAMWTAPGPLGPWTKVGDCVLNGTTAQPWHGDVIWHNGAWISLWSVRGPMHAMISTDDGLTWNVGPDIAGLSTVARCYRPCMLPSTEAGMIDVWSGSLDGPSVRYFRLSETTWTDLSL